jgi:hypothetical protein
MKLALARLALGIGGPIGLFYVLRGLGVSDLAALAAGTVLPALGAGYTLIVKHRADTVSVFMLATMALALLTSVIIHSPRLLLAKDGIMTGFWGLWFLFSARGQRPAALIFARPLMEHMKLFASRSWDLLWDAEPRFRRIWRVTSVMWGVALLVDAAVRAVISYTLPVDAVPGIGGLLFPVTFVILQVAANVYFAHAGLYRLLGARWPQGQALPRGERVPREERVPR